MGKIDGLDELYPTQVGYNKRWAECANKALLSRMSSWALVHVALYMLSPRYPRGNWEGEPWRLEWIKNLLIRVDMLLANVKNLSQHDPVITKDLGGDIEMNTVRAWIRTAIGYLDMGNEDMARSYVLSISRKLYYNAVNKFIYCLDDVERDPLEGVSTTRKRREQPELYEHGM